MSSVTIGGNAYPTYEDVADADLYLAADPSRSTAWLARTPDQKGQGLVSATRLLLAQSSWCSPPTDPATGIIPQPLADATALLAADILTKPALVSNPSGAASNLKRAKAGPVEVEYFGTNVLVTPPPLPAEIWQMLQTAGILGCTGDATSDGAYVSGVDGCGPFAPRRTFGGYGYGYGYDDHSGAYCEWGGYGY